MIIPVGKRQMLWMSCISLCEVVSCLIMSCSEGASPGKGRPRVDCQPRGSLLPRQGGFGTKSWVCSHEGHMSQVCAPSLDMECWQGLSCSGLRSSWGGVWGARKSREGLPTHIPENTVPSSSGRPWSSETTFQLLTVTRTLCLALCTCCSVVGVSSPPRIRSKESEAWRREGLAQAT